MNSDNDREFFVELNLRVVLPPMSLSRTVDKIIGDVVRGIEMNHGNVVKVDSAWRIKEDKIDLGGYH